MPDPIATTAGAKPLDTDSMYLNMGPQHPSTHGVLRLLLKTDGEIVEDVTPCVGYLHRCAEKIGENLSYVQFVPYTDRLDYVSSMSDNLGFCLAAEALIGMEIPRRATYIRVLHAELQRIASHLLAFGTYGLDIGAFTPFLYAFREREMVLNLFEMSSGARLTYNYVRIGGVRGDVSKEFVAKTREFLAALERYFPEYNELLSFNQIFIQRTAKLGVITPEAAKSWAITGPNLRASGIPWDLRRVEPYCGYGEFKFDVITGRPHPGVIGDCYNRYYVRILEMMESVKIVKQCLEGLPEGKICADLKKVIKVPAGEKYLRIENPRGELGYYIVSDGTDKPLRCKIRAPSFSNTAIIPAISKGCLIADMVAIVGSVDIVLGEVDR